eukprot:7445793-Pyramimonas_sp.AAC.1
MHDEIAQTVTLTVETAADRTEQVLVMTNAITRAKLSIEMTPEALALLRTQPYVPNSEQQDAVDPNVSLPH